MGPRARHPTFPRSRGGLSRVAVPRRTAAPAGVRQRHTMTGIVTETVDLSRYAKGRGGSSRFTGCVARPR